MNPSEIDELIDIITALPGDWHGQGTVGRNVLTAIAKHVNTAGGIQNSVETGSGKTTLLLSQISARHTVFAIDLDDSISQVRNSPHFNGATTSYVEGPTQRTLSKHQWTDLNQLVLIDGPHGYPFPDLEYFYLYPTIAPGGLLIIDDIQIPSIQRMFEIIQAEDMFELIEVVDENTAFFKRTASPMIDPESDSWWLQGYNRAYYRNKTDIHPSIESPKTGLVRLLQAISRVVPTGLKRLLPHGIKEKIWQQSAGR